jgi:hypothetical protein
MKKETHITRNLIFSAAGTVLILMVPLIAMQFTREVDWDVRDFTIMGILLFGTGALYTFISSMVSTTKMRIIIGTVLFILLFLTWAELAVGVFGTPFAGS